MTTAARIKANRENAQKSTGPKSDAGKARSSRNAVRHGLTAKMPVVLPAENEEEYRDRLRRWLEDFPPADMAQRSLIERAVHAAWRLERLARREAAVLSSQARRAADDFNRAERDRVAALGERLLSDPLNRCDDLPDAEARAANEIWLKDSPGAIVRELERSAAGIDWLIVEWAQLRELLNDEGYWHYDRMYHAIRMLKRRSEDVLVDPFIMKIFLAFRAAHIDQWDLWDSCYQATIGVAGRPVYFMRVYHFQEKQPETPEDARAFLYSVVDAEIVRLGRLRAEVAPISALDRAEAADRSLFEEGPSTALVMRYEASAAREFHRCVGDLMKLRKDNPGPEEFEEEAIAEEAVAIVEEAVADVEEAEPPPCIVENSAPEQEPVETKIAGDKTVASHKKTRRRSVRNEPKPEGAGTSPDRPTAPPEGRREAPGSHWPPPKAT